MPNSFIYNRFFSYRGDVSRRKLSSATDKFLFSIVVVFAFFVLLLMVHLINISAHITLTYNRAFFMHVFINTRSHCMLLFLTLLSTKYHTDRRKTPIIQQQVIIRSLLMMMMMMISTLGKLSKYKYTDVYRSCRIVR